MQKQEIITKILELWEISGSDYGDNVIPTMELYASLSTPDDRLVFQKALESLLVHDDPNIRNKAVSQCLGFFVFRDAI